MLKKINLLPMKSKKLLMKITDPRKRAKVLCSDEICKKCPNLSMIECIDCKIQNLIKSELCGPCCKDPQ